MNNLFAVGNFLIWKFGSRFSGMNDDFKGLVCTALHRTLVRSSCHKLYPYLQIYHDRLRRFLKIILSIITLKNKLYTLFMMQSQLNAVNGRYLFYNKRKFFLIWTICLYFSIISKIYFVEQQPIYDCENQLSRATQSVVFSTRLQRHIVPLN